MKAVYSSIVVIFISFVIFYEINFNSEILDHWYMILLITVVSIVGIIAIIRTFFILRAGVIFKKRKSCFWGHEWERWTQSHEQWKHINHQTHGETGYTKEVQTRHCKRCNKKQIEYLK